jgi:hypothetical protein
MGLAKGHPAYAKKVGYDKAYRERRRNGTPFESRKVGYYAPVDCKGRLLSGEGLWIMTYKELFDLAGSGYLSSGLRLEQADVSGNSLGVYVLDIQDDRPVLKKERLGIG